ncbi:MAG TPA: glutamate synthase large subunit [Actinomycetes bacterium]|nr:glutamate synthase large subunit [Actinomycetes bacterium]
MYDPNYEHDACGVAFIATLSGQASHSVVADALTALRNLEHRGASGADPYTGDGAGIVLRVPDAFFHEVTPFDLPSPGAYAVGAAFAATAQDAERFAGAVPAIAEAEGLDVLGWRDVPVSPELLGAEAARSRPLMRQLFLATADGLSGLALDRRCFAFRKQLEHATDVYFPSLSSRTIVYKGMLTASQLEPFYPDLSDHRLASPIAVVHSRFSTNTFPSWSLAHPYRLVAHNGEINTVRGNRNWMRARESELSSGAIGGDVQRLLPICTPGASDSATFDEVLELLHLGGRSLPHAMLMMIPEAWEHHAAMPSQRRDFYRYHATLMEPWDGPASVCFTDGSLVGAVLDRNGLRPGRYWVTDDDRVVFASEVGVLDIDPSKVVSKGRLQPGRMLLVDTAEGRLIDDDEIKAQLAEATPYSDWLHAGVIELTDLPDRTHVIHSHESVLRRQQTFGYTEEELRLLIAPMASEGAEALGSMGTDTPIAVLSQRPRLLFDYFTQQFAQVTNPPLDAIREELVTSLATFVGPEHDLMSPTPASCRQISVPFPVINNDDLAKLLHINHDGDLPGFAADRVKTLYRVAGGEATLTERLENICDEVTRLIERGIRFVVLSDRDSNAELAPIPSLLATAAVHHHLVRSGMRAAVSLLVEAGDVREVHHVACLIGYGAAAVNPYLAMETAEDLVRERAVRDLTPEQAVNNLVQALGKGVLKVMSKMGVSTVASYRGAQLFEAVGLSQTLVNRWFTGTATRLGGVELEVIASEVAQRHAVAYPAAGLSPSHRRLDEGGEYQWRRDGEIHLFDPETVFRLQHATREKRFDIFESYSARVNEQSERRLTLRGLLQWRPDHRPPVPLDEVEPVSEIMKRFSTGAMSYGSISQEAHETLAIAMNGIGARSNSGEGGEDVDRLRDDARRSAIKQIASGRFGVTSEYLVTATDLQIKMAQGAKPGEGGQLPGSKVYPWIAKTRHATAGVGLISPPPHHDIYSIEDLAQLIHDLKCANTSARVHVKLVSEVGVGTVAAGVAKAHADVVLISGHDGGTGAAPLTSLKHAGTPWEIGLAETQQTLLMNGLRDRIVVQVDGQLRTGRDVMIAALLGAEEFGFASAPLVVMGCVMMRVCHLDTCPVGIATQDPVLRQRFAGQPEFVATFFEFVATEVRQLLASLGFRTLDEAIGQVECLDVDRAVTHWKACGLKLESLLHVPPPPQNQSASRRATTQQEHGLAKQLDNALIPAAMDAITTGVSVQLSAPVRNTDRSVGAMLGAEVTRRRATNPLADDTVDITLTGSAGQSLGAFLPKGVTLRLFGDANDYVGKGLSGGRIIVQPSSDSQFAAELNVVAGNVLLYGATSGESFIRGLVGERFCVRNSGATAVVEGVGDHACEYMTGGRAVILGATGRNFAAGMSGGIAFVLDLDPSLVNNDGLEHDKLSNNDAQWLAELLYRYAVDTSSPLAARLLVDWESTRSRFTALVPRQYRAAIERESLEVVNA